jgi:hypothetical protein
MKQTDIYVKNFVNSLPNRSQFPKNTTEKDLIDAFQSGDFFGILEVDIHVPDDLKDQFHELTPIFKSFQIDDQIDCNGHYTVFYCFLCCTESKA